MKYKLSERLYEAIVVHNGEELRKVFFDLAKGMLLGLIGAQIFLGKGIYVYISIAVIAFIVIGLIVLGIAIGDMHKAEENDKDDQACSG